MPNTEEIIRNIQIFGITTVVPVDLPLDFLKEEFTECRWLGKVRKIRKYPNDNRDSCYIGEEYMRIIVWFEELYSDAYTVANQYSVGPAVLGMFVPKGLTKSSHGGSMDCSDSYLFSFNLEVNNPPTVNMLPIESRVTYLERDLRESREEIKKLVHQTERQADIIKRLIDGLYDTDDQQYRKLCFDTLEGGNTRTFADQPDTSKQMNVLAKIVSRIESLESGIKSLESVVGQVQDVVRSLIKGLFNPITQNATLNKLVAALYGTSNCSTNNDTSEWESQPTTVQCDEAEKRLDALEEVVFKGTIGSPYTKR